MPRTCGRNAAIRLTMSCLSLAASNIWMIAGAGRRGGAVRLRVLLAGLVAECARPRIRRPPDPG